MAWIELHQAVFTHRKTFELADALGLDDTYAAAHVIRLWLWALDNAPDGNLAGLSARQIAYGAGWHAEADRLVDGLLHARWLDEDRRIHDWDEYAGRLVERRRQDAERKRNERAGRLQDIRPDPNGTETGVRRTVPNRTLHNITGPDLDSTRPRAAAPADATKASKDLRGRTGGDPAPGPPPDTDDSAAPLLPEPVTPLTDQDRELWNRTLAALVPQLTGADHAEVRTLEPLGRSADGGLALQAPKDRPYPGLVTRYQRSIARVLAECGDAHAVNVSIR